MVLEILNFTDQRNSTSWFRHNRLLDRGENSTHQSLEVGTLIKNSFEAVLTTGIRVLWCQSLSTWKLKWSKSQKLVSPLIFRLYLLNHIFLDFNIQISDFTSYRNVQIKKLVCNRPLNSDIKMGKCSPYCPQCLHIYVERKFRDPAFFEHHFS